MKEELYISDRIVEKIKNKHRLDKDEVIQAWKKYDGITLADTRERYWTYPPTEWFLVRSDSGKLLKIIFMIDDDGTAYLKSAFEADKTEKRIFLAHGGIL